MQSFGVKTFAEFGVKSCTEFWWSSDQHKKKLCRVLVQKTEQDFGVKTCAGFSCKKLRKVLV